MNLLLQRDVAATTYTYGTLEVATLVLQTIERPWVPDPLGPGGMPDASCVPVGTYDLVMHDTVSHPRTWALVNPSLAVYHEPGDIPPGTRGRSACLIHAGNLAVQSEGCVLVGLSRSELLGEPDVALSQAALAKLHEVLPWENGHTLTIL